MNSDKMSVTDSSSESEYFLDKPILYVRPRKVWPWIASTIFFSLLSAGLFLKPDARDSCVNTNESSAPDYKQQVWRRSDFAPARDVIELQDVQFTGNSAYDDNGRFFINNPSPIDYRGAGAEVDEAWHNLTLRGQRDFILSEDEAIALWPNDYKIHWHEEKQGYAVGLDVFHTLHCIDNLRKYFYPDVYPVKKTHKDSMGLHQGHCLDQLRQYVMCAGDMTPYGMRWYPNPGRYYADSDVTHTCRNFDKLHEWAANRYHAGGNIHIPGVEVWSPFENGI